MAKRTLTYWRTNWLGGEVPGYPNLETVLRSLLQAFPSVGASAVHRGDGSIVEIRHRRAVEGQPVLLHCAMHEPGAEGSVVPRTNTEQQMAPLQTISAPEGSEFLGGALIALVSGNHCLICAHTLTIAALRYFLQQLVIRRGLPPQAQRFDFDAVANRDKLNEIIKSGVSEVGLLTTLDEFEAGDQAPTLVERAKAQMAETFATLFGQDYTIDDLLGQDLANLNARLTIKFDKRKHGFIDQEAFDEAARHIIEEEDPGIYIKLRSGSRIDHQNIKLSKKVNIDSHGSTIDYAQAWVKLEEYYSELIAAGYITLNAD